MTENQIATKVVDAALQIHRKLGPGLLESVYVTVLCHVLRDLGLQVAKQVLVPIAYGDLRIERGFLADLVIENKVIVEVKSVQRLAPVHPKQLLTYLRLSDCRLGLLLNFNEALIKDGIQRVVNGLEE